MYVNLACEVWLSVVVIHIVDDGFWLALPVDIGLKSAKPCSNIFVLCGCFNFRYSLIGKVPKDGKLTSTHTPIPVKSYKKKYNVWSINMPMQ